MATNAASAAASTARLCIFLALPSIICAPVPSDDATTAAEEIPHYLRHAASENNQDDSRQSSSNDSFLMSLVALLEGGFFPSREEDVERFTTSHDDSSDAATAGDETDFHEGEDFSVSPLRIDDEDLEDHSDERRLQATTEKWYVNWFESKCVQSCPPSAENPYCAGKARWDQHLFDTADYCCKITMNWQPIEDCTGTGHSENYMTSLTIDNSKNSGFVDGDDCPDEYSGLTDYRALDTATIFVTEIKGDVYECKDGPLSQYCNMFPPDWSRVSYGAGSLVHHSSDALGWKIVGDCYVEQDDDGNRPLQGNLNGHGAGASGTGGSGAGSPTGAGSGGAGGSDSDPWAVSPADGGFGPSSIGSGSSPGAGPAGGSPAGSGSEGAAGSNNSPGSYTPGASPVTGGTSPSAGNNGPSSGKKPPVASKPARPPRPTRPNRPIRPNKPTAQQILDGINGGDHSPSTSGSQPTTGTGDGTGASPSAGGGGCDPSSSSGSGSTTGLTGPDGSIGFGPGEGTSSGSGSGPSNAGDATPSNGKTPAMSKPSLAASKPPRPARPNKPTAQQILDGINGGDYSPSTIGSGPQPTTGTGDGTGASPSAGGGSDPSSSGGSGSTTGLTGPDGSIGFGKGAGSGSGPSNTGDSGASSSANNDNGPSSSNASGTSGPGTGGASSSSATGSDPSNGKAPAMSKPSSQGGQEDANDTDGDISSIVRPRPYRPFKPKRPYKPEPAIQVQQGPDPNDNEDSPIIEKDGVQCYRSGMDCISDAEHFACCTMCINGICI